MKKILFAFCIICMVQYSKAQNLIKNPSFEQTRGGCHLGPGFDIYMYGTYDTIDINDTSNCYLKDWFFMTNTPDVYSFNSYTFRLPTSDYNCKNIYPYNGNNIVGVVQFTKYDSSGFYLNSREIMENKLADTLKAGHKYKLSFYTQLFDSMASWRLGWGKILAANSFSVYFSNTVLNWQSNTPFKFGVYQPQIQIDTMVTDTQHWVLLTDTFTAKGGEQYMAVGNFKPDSLTQSQLVDSVRAGSGFSYYFYDDFSLIDLTPDGVEELESKKLQLYPNPVNNVLICQCANMPMNTIEVTDVLGRIVFQQINKSLNQQVQIDVSSLSNGIYFIKATDTKGNVKVGRFVKE